MLGAGMQANLNLLPTLTGKFVGIVLLGSQALKLGMYSIGVVRFLLLIIIPPQMSPWQPIEHEH